MLTRLHYSNFSSFWLPNSSHRLWVRVWPQNLVLLSRPNLRGIRWENEPLYKTYCARMPRFSRRSSVVTTKKGQDATVPGSNFKDGMPQIPLLTDKRF